MYYYRNQPDVASVVPTNSLYHEINISAMRVNNLFIIHGLTNSERRNEYKYDSKTVFFFVLKSGYNSYPEYPGEEQFGNFLVGSHCTFSYPRFSALHKQWANRASDK